MATYTQIIEGLEIIRKHAKKGEQDLGGADHDILWGCPIADVTDDEDKKRLHKLGWFEDSASGCWSIFV